MKHDILSAWGPTLMQRTAGQGPPVPEEFLRDPGVEALLTEAMRKIVDGLYRPFKGNFHWDPDVTPPSDMVERAFFSVSGTDITITPTRGDAWTLTGKVDHGSLSSTDVDIFYADFELGPASMSADEAAAKVPRLLNIVGGNEEGIGKSRGVWVANVASSLTNRIGHKNSPANKEFPLIYICWGSYVPLRIPAKVIPKATRRVLYDVNPVEVAQMAGSVKPLLDVDYTVMDLLGMGISVDTVQKEISLRDLASAGVPASALVKEVPLHTLAAAGFQGIEWTTRVSLGGKIIQENIHPDKAAAEASAKTLVVEIVPVLRQ